MRWLVAALISAMMVAVGATQTAAQPVGNDWPEYLHDVGGSGFTGETVLNPANAASLKVKVGWPAKLNNGAGCPSKKDFCSSFIGAQPVIATVAGTALVYVGSWNGDEYALCAATCSLNGKNFTSGQVVWSTYLGRTSGCGGPFNSRIQGVTTTAVVTSVVINSVTRNVVYAGGGGDISFAGKVISGASAQLFALDALTGAVIWQTPVGSSPSHYVWSSPVLANSSLYLGMASLGDCPLVQGQVLQLDPSSGQVLNTFAVVPAKCTGGGVWGSAAVDASGFVYVATGNSGSCATAEPLAVAVLKLSSTLGLVSSWQVPNNEQTSDGDFGSTPTLFTGTVTPTGSLRSLLGVPNKNGFYYVFDQSSINTGPLVRIRVAAGGPLPQGGGGSISPSSWDGHTIYVAGGNTTISGKSYAGSLRAFDPNNLGSPLWQHGFGGPCLGAVATDPGLAVAAAGAFATVVNSSTGVTIFKGTGSTFWSAPSIAYGVLYIGDTSGMLRAFSVNGQ